MKKVIYFNEGKELAFYQQGNEVMFVIKHSKKSDNPQTPDLIETTEVLTSISMSEIEDMLMELENILEQNQDERPN
jgi:hypothetical protein